MRGNALMIALITVAGLTFASVAQGVDFFSFEGNGDPTLGGWRLLGVDGGDPVADHLGEPTILLRTCFEIEFMRWQGVSTSAQSWRCR